MSEKGGTAVIQSIQILDDDDHGNVLDIVLLANAVLQGDDIPSGDMNGDGNYNVLDIVQLANCVLQGTCTGEVYE